MAEDDRDVSRRSWLLAAASCKEQKDKGQQYAETKMCHLDFLCSAGNAELLMRFCRNRRKAEAKAPDVGLFLPLEVYLNLLGCLVCAHGYGADFPGLVAEGLNPANRIADLVFGNNQDVAYA